MSKPDYKTNNSQHGQAREYIFSNVIESADGRGAAEDVLSESVAQALQRALDEYETPVEVTLTAEITPHGGVE